MLPQLPQFFVHVPVTAPQSLHTPPGGHTIAVVGGGIAGVLGAAVDGDGDGDGEGDGTGVGGGDGDEGAAWDGAGVIGGDG